ncbi:VCBS domain-containing protein [Endozoicomonas sp. 4G]|uniref:VCBS domain-containing protein n=1 Tax=Endozoicomonas sp. 4G TaxID=2872754 RepID=UPI0020786947|nr:VCBS domain-containing protein [Endozoicomonas sp. 4G]
MNSNSDGSRPVIGHVQDTDGDVFAIAPDGSKRILKEGDPLYLNERVVSESSGPVSILLVNSEVIQLEGQSQLVMLENMLQTASPSDAKLSSEIEEILDANADRAGSAEIPPIKVNPVDVAELSSSEEPDSSSQDPGPEVSNGFSSEVVVVEREATELEEQSKTKPLSESSEEIEQPLKSIEPLPVSERYHEVLTASVPVNYAPTAQNMVMGSSESATELEGKLQAYDANSGEALKFSLVTAPDSGQLILNDDGSFRFLPGSDFDYLAAGEQSVVTFVFQAKDSRGASSRASVDITITGESDVGDAPETAEPVLAELVQSDGETTIDLLSQAFDKDPSETLSVTQLRLTEGNEAGVSIGLDGSSLSVDPEAYKYLAAGETETLTYEYRVTNSRGESVLESVTITLSGDNDQPQVREAVIQTFDKNSDDFNVDLLAGAFDLDASDSLKAVSLKITAGDPSGITIADDDNSLAVDASAYEHLAAGESEVIEYSYEIEDGQGGVVSQSASITIEGSNDNPEDIDLSGTRIDENQDGAVVGTLSTTDKDLSDTHTYTVDDHRFEVVDGDLKLKEGIALDHETDESVDVKVTTTDVDGAAYSESFTLEVNDINEAPVVGNVDLIISVNDAPVSAGTLVTSDEDTPYIFSTSDFAFTDPDAGQTLQSIKITQLPLAGALLFNGSAVTAGMEVTKSELLAGRLKFEPTQNEHGNLYASFEFQVSDGQLFSSSATFDFSITSVNDDPTVSSAIAKNVVEDSASVNIDLLESAADVDVGDNLSVTQITLSSGDDSGITINGNILTIDPGAYDYLPDGVTETIVYSYDIEDGNGGSVAQTATLVITGTNDTAQITGLDTVTVAEDSHASTLTTSGSLTVIDADQGEASFTAETITGSYGSLTINASGSWSYSASNSQADIQALGNGDSLTETLTVRSLDGTTHNIVININGTNDVAVITGDDTGSVTEDVGNTLMTSGTLSVTDVDGGEASFTAETITGSYGSLAIANNGSWNYSASNSQADIQTLGNGDSLSETITVKSLDGTTHNIVITINGTNDVAVITGDDSGSVTEDAGNTLMTSGTLSVTDVDGGEASFTAETITGSYGSLTIANNGSWNYSANNSQADIQALGNGDSLTETLTVRSLDGTTHNIVITINGTNDAAVITGDDSGSVTEDAGNTLMTSGTLSVTDVDGGEASFTAETITGSYGSLSINASGSWSYSASNNQADIQALGDGDTLTETLTVKSLDGTTHNIVITINGTNDAAVITGDDSGSVTEDAGNILMTSGTLSVTDVDGGEASFTAETITGSYGSLTINGSGSWSYSANNNQADIQALGDGDTLTETVTVKSLDGTTHNIVITINGTNDAAVITGDDSGSVTEDASNTLVTSGTLSVTDVDGGEAGFTAETITGSYGSLTIANNGSWNYSANNSQADIQALGNGDSLTETLTVRSLDGTTHNIVITINGTNDAAVITGDDSGSVTEDAGNTLMTSGTLSVTDVDGGEASFTAETITGSYGSLTINGSGSWSYSASNNHADIQALGDGDSLTETITVKSLDGTTHNIVITINGTNDAAVITGDDSGSVTEDAGNTLMTSGTLSVTDVDGGEASFTAETITGSYGSLIIDASGSWSYSASNSQADIKALGNGDSLTETITVKSLDGTTHNIVITINGTNDVAVITGDDSGSVTEDAGNTLMTSGTLSVTDVDGGEASFTAETITGSYGSLTINGSGSWSYSANNNRADIQALGDGDTLTETVTVKSLDGTTHNIVITINGTNDAAVITGDDSGSVTEDASNTLVTSGTLSVTDADGGEASFTAETITGSYGSLTINTSGSWSYSASNSQADIQALGNGDSLTETITVKTLDGTTHNIVITVNGTNDAAVITGDDSGSVTEDAGNTLMTSGTLSVTDVDGGEAGFTAETITGSYGSLIIDASGSWSYSASNNHADIQALGDGDSLSETITVKSLDGTTHNIVITINGTNDAAVITGDDSGSVTEDASNTLVTSGTLTVTDVDGGEASFTAETITGSYGSLTINGSGSWSYSASNSQADIQTLGDGDALTETITVKSLDGTTRDIVITINGTNDAAVITGDDSGSVTEDAGNTLTTSGTLTVTDVDSGEASFTAETITGTYGSLTINGSGSWSYSASNSQADIQTLGNGDSLSETITVKSLDGTTHNIVITINGTNDAAVITGDDTGSVTEDAGNTLTTSGTLTVTDVDGGEASFTAETITGSYGSLAIANNGSWNYSASNSQADIQTLGNGDSLSETITVKSLDGTTHNIVITINGTNDAAVITGDDSGSVTEDASNTLVTSGTLTVTDVDGGEAGFTAETITGSYGSLTINGSGSWSYSANNNHADIQALGNGDSLTETLTVRSLDGTTHNIVITINGTNDAAVITGDDSGSVTEDAGNTLMTSGTLIVTDVDGGEASFTAETITGSYGSLTINGSGSWSYSASNNHADIQALGDGDSLTETITVKSLDGTTHNIVITINGTNDAAVITGDDSGSVTEDVGNTLMTSGTLSITDVDGGEASFTAETITGSYGSLAINGSGSWSYSASNSQADIQTLGDGDTLTETITVKSLDGTTHNIVITINGTNDGPAIDAGTADQSATEEQAFSYQLPANAFSDIDGDNLTYSATLDDGSPLPAWLSFDPSNGTFSGTPDDPDLGQITIKVTASDGVLSVSDQFKINVVGVNDAPELVGSINNQTVAEESAFSYTIPANAFSDAEGDALTYSASLANGNPLPAWLTFDAATRTFSGTPDDPDVGNLSVRISVSDGSETTDVLWSIDVTAVNDAPELSSSPLIEGVEAAYSFSDNTDISGNGNNLTLNGNATLGSGHNGGQALELDGSSSSSGEISGLKIGGALTISAWVKYDSFSQGWSRVIDFGDGFADNNILLSRVGTGSGLAFQIFDGAGYPADGELIISDFFTEGEWVHVTATVDDSGAMRVYKDGELAGENLNGALIPEIVRSNNYVGRSHGINDASMDGSIGDLAIFNTGLSAHQVKAAYQADSVANLVSDAFHVIEQSANGTVLGSVTATDVDSASNLLTYSLTNDAGGRFAINSVTGEISVADSTLLDHDSNASHTITVQVSDGQLSSTHNYTVYLTESTLFSDEDTSYTLTLTDLSSSGQEADAMTQIKVSTLPDEGSLKLNGVVVTANQVISKADIEAGLLVFEPDSDENGNNYTSFGFQVYDGSSYSGEHTRTFDIVAVNDAPIAPAAVVEKIDFVWGGASITNKSADSFNLPNGFELGDSVWLIKTGGSYSKGVKIQITENQNGTLNFKAIEAKYTDLATWNSLSSAQKTTYFETAGTATSVATSNSDIGYGISDIAVNGGSAVSGFLDTATGKNVDPLSAVENSSNGTVVGSVKATDAEGDNLVYSLTNDAGGRFAINSATGEITVADGSLLDYEASSTHAIAVQVSDGQLTSQQNYTIQISDTNDAPELLGSPLISGVEAAYSFSDNTDISGNGNNLTLSGSATLGSGHNGGQAFEMDGSSGSGEISGLKLGGAMTISAWVKYDSLSQNWSRIVDFGDGSANNNILLAHIGTGNALAFEIFDGGSKVGQLHINNFFTAGEWLHVTATVDDNGVMRVYKNGELAGENLNGAAPPEIVRSGNYIGKSHWNDGHLDGSIGELAIFNTGLGAHQVKALYEADSVENLVSDAFHVVEQTANGIVLGSVAATDVDNASNQLTYSLINDAGGRFTINSATGEISVADSTLLDHDSNASHTIRVQVSDGQLSSTRDYTVYVNSSTLSANEDTSYALTLTDLSHSAQEAADMTQIKVSTLPDEGSLKLNGVAVTQDQVISKADIEAGLLVFEPDSNEAGDDYTSIGFKIHDGNSYSGEYTRTFDVAAVADSVTMNNISSEVLNSTFDGNNADGWQRSNPYGINYSLVKNNQLHNYHLTESYRNIDTSDSSVQTYELTFTLNHMRNLHHTTNIWVKWNGQTVATYSEAPGSGTHTSTKTILLNATGNPSTELRFDESSNEFTADNIRITKVRATDEDTAFNLPDLGITQVDTDGSETLTVSANGVPAGAVLTDGSHSITADGTAVDISGWDFANLQITPPADSTDTMNLTFTATTTESNGDSSSVSESLSIRVNSVDDKPVSSDNSLLLKQTDSYTFSAEDFSFTDVDAGDSLQSVTITTLPASGSLTLNGAAVTANQVITAADLGNLTYTAPATNPDVGTSFGFTVSDGSLSSDPQTFTLNVRGAYSQNLLTNSSGQNGTSDWNIIENGGDGWASTHISHDGDGKGWVTSHEWAKKSQTIDLVAKGFTEQYLDSAPDIGVSDWFKDTHLDDDYYLKVELRDASNNVITSYNSGTLTASDNWQEAASTFSNYGAGVRYIYFEHGGRDQEGWAGNYGAVIDDSKVFLKVGDVDLVGTHSGEIIDGTAQSDTIKGEGGADTLIGDAGDDLIFGGAGEDIITGGVGDDTLTGGDDSDTFVWLSSDLGSVATPAQDIIKDFNTGSGGDIIDLSDVLVDDSISLDQYLNLNFSNGDTTIEVMPGADGSVTQKIKLEGVDLSNYGGGGTEAQILNNLLNDGNLQID